MKTPLVHHSSLIPQVYPMAHQRSSITHGFESTPRMKTAGRYQMQCCSRPQRGRMQWNLFSSSAGHIDLWKVHTCDQWLCFCSGSHLKMFGFSGHTRSQTFIIHFFKHSPSLKGRADFVISVATIKIALQQPHIVIYLLRLLWNQISFHLFYFLVPLSHAQAVKLVLVFDFIVPPDVIQCCLYVTML